MIFFKTLLYINTPKLDRKLSFTIKKRYDKLHIRCQGAQSKMNFG